MLDYVSTITRLPLTEAIGQFDGDLFVRLVERVVVRGKAVVFRMKTGVEICGKVH